MRKEFEMTKEELDEILKASESIPLIMLQCGMPPTPQERANAAWRELGKKRGFDWKTVRPVSGKSQNTFVAEEVV